MKKQYNYYEIYSFRFCLKIYHNGKLISNEKLWLDDLNDRVDSLEEQGYTYGFTKEEVEEAKKRYDKILANMIEESE